MGLIWVSRADDSQAHRCFYREPARGGLTLHVFINTLFIISARAGLLDLNCKSGRLKSIDAQLLIHVCGSVIGQNIRAAIASDRSFIPLCLMVSVAGNSVASKRVCFLSRRVSAV